MSKDFLFTATVSAVYPNEKAETVGNKKTIVRNSYTIDAVPTMLGRQMYINIPVMKPTSGGNKGGTGFVWLPSVGDLVVCAFIEGHDSLPVCLGTIHSPKTQTITSVGNTINDCTFHHITGSYIRMRNPGGNFRSSEIEIKHNKGTTIKIETNGDVTINGVGDINITDTNLNINCGTDASITAGGNVTIEASGDAVVKAGGKAQLNSPKVELGASAAEKIIKGDSFMSYFNTHIHPTGVGPSGPPTSPMQTSLLSTVSKTE